MNLHREHSPLHSLLSKLIHCSLWADLDTKIDIPIRPAPGQNRIKIESSRVESFKLFLGDIHCKIVNSIGCLIPVAMMKIEYYFLISLSFCCMCHVRAECCYREDVVFVNKKENRSCSDYGASDGVCDVLTLCVIELCGDGLPPTGWFCGVGDCNMFGCNCDYGCIPGDAKQIFSKRYGKNIIVVN